MRWVLIRHGKTQGNLERRYIGCRTDESLCAQGVEELCSKRVPPVRCVYASPMKRCVETAALLYPGVPVEMVEDFRECDFGVFENKNFQELDGRADYQAWIDSGGETPFPGGESRADFCLRCIRAFEKIQNQPYDCAVIAHGGTLMAIMEAKTSGSYYDFQVENGEGFVLEEDGCFQRI